MPVEAPVATLTIAAPADDRNESREYRASAEALPRRHGSRPQALSELQAPSSLTERRPIQPDSRIDETKQNQDCRRHINRLQAQYILRGYTAAPECMGRQRESQPEFNTMNSVSTKGSAELKWLG
jgi:hypothetical protein